ncbi:hypothetical protein GCM10027258_35330 [Amycolatopsis stemonae]
MIGSASTSKCAARAAAAVKAVRLMRGAIAGKSAAVMVPRYRFDFEHITNTNLRQDSAHSGLVAVTLDTGGAAARAAIVDASRVSRVPDGIRQVRVSPTVFWRR